MRNEATSDKERGRRKAEGRCIRRDGSSDVVNVSGQGTSPNLVPIRLMVDDLHHTQLWRHKLKCPSAASTMRASSPAPALSAASKTSRTSSWRRSSFTSYSAPTKPEEPDWP